MILPNNWVNMLTPVALSVSSLITFTDESLRLFLWFQGTTVKILGHLSVNNHCNYHKNWTTSLFMCDNCYWEYVKMLMGWKQCRLWSDCSLEQSDLGLDCFIKFLSQNLGPLRYSGKYQNNWSDCVSWSWLSRWKKKKNLKFTEFQRRCSFTCYGHFFMFPY